MNHFLNYRLGNIYFLLKNNEKAYGGQSVDPLRRIREHKRNKDFDDFVIIEFPLFEGEELNVVEMDVIKRYNLKNNGLNKSLSHKDEYERLKDTPKYKKLLADFYNHVKTYGYFNDTNSMNKNWEIVFINQQESGLCEADWCLENNCDYQDFIRETEEFMNTYWKNQFVEQQKNDLSEEDWCANKYYYYETFMEYTKQFRYMNGEEVNRVNSRLFYNM